MSPFGRVPSGTRLPESGFGPLRWAAAITNLAAEPLLVADGGLQGVADGGTGGRSVRQARTGQRVGVEQVQFTAEPAVVVHGGLLTDEGAKDRRPESRGCGFRHRSARRDILRRRRHGGHANTGRAVVVGCGQGRGSSGAGPWRVRRQW